MFYKGYMEIKYSSFDETEVHPSFKIILNRINIAKYMYSSLYLGTKTTILDRYVGHELPMHLNKALKEGPTENGCFADLKGNDSDK